MKAKYVDANIIVHEGKEAEKLLLEHNDSKFLSDGGIVQISNERWKEAQSYEHRTWMIQGLGATDDHNKENIEQFDHFKVLNENVFSRAIELGCGPFTNIYWLEKLLEIKTITVLDPLLNEYLKHPKNRIQLNWKRIQSPIESFNIDIPYDLIVMINVLEHCFDIPVIFSKILQMIEPNGIFVFGDIHFDSHTIEEMSLNAYNAGHPIRIETENLYDFLGNNFKPLYRKEFVTKIAGRDATEIYFIGEKR